MITYRNNLGPILVLLAIVFFMVWDNLNQNQGEVKSGTSSSESIESSTWDEEDPSDLTSNSGNNIKPKRHIANKYKNHALRYLLKLQH